MWPRRPHGLIHTPASHQLSTAPSLTHGPLCPAPPAQPGHWSPERTLGRAGGRGLQWTREPLLARKSTSRPPCWAEVKMNLLCSPASGCQNLPSCMGRRPHLLPCSPLASGPQCLHLPCASTLIARPGSPVLAPTALLPCYCFLCLYIPQSGQPQGFCMSCSYCVERTFPRGHCPQEGARALPRMGGPQLLCGRELAENCMSAKG